MPRTPWSINEMILALDLYRRLVGAGAKLTPTHPDVKALSAVTGRPASSIAMRLGNYAALDPTYPKAGLAKVGPRTQAFWDYYAAHPKQLAIDVASIHRGATITHPSLY